MKRGKLGEVEIIAANGTRKRKRFKKLEKYLSDKNLSNFHSTEQLINLKIISYSKGSRVKEKENELIKSPSFTY